MYDSSAFPESLDENVFEEWLENGRENKIGYRFLIVIWDSYDNAYKPIYAEEFDQIYKFEEYGLSAERESLIAAYDLYSESKVG